MHPRAQMHNGCTSGVHGCPKPSLTAHSPLRPTYDSPITIQLLAISTFFTSCFARTELNSISTHSLQRQMDIGWCCDCNYIQDMESSRNASERERFRNDGPIFYTRHVLCSFSLIVTCIISLSWPTVVWVDIRPLFSFWLGGNVQILEMWIWVYKCWEPQSVAALEYHLRSP